MASSMLVVELQQARTLLAEFTRRLPGSRVDLVQTPASQGAPAGLLRFVMLVRGVPQAAYEALAAGIASVTGRPPETRPWTEKDGWLLAASFPAAAIDDPALGAVHKCLDRHGLQVRWTRIEDGVLYVCSQVPAGDDAHALSGNVQGWLEACGVEADVAVEVLPTGTLSVWRDLLAAIGDAPMAAGPGAGTGAAPGPDGTRRAPR